MSYLSDFKTIENWYNRTPPVISRRHTEADDIRPISDRRRKHERIAKINRNCYALIGGYMDDGVGYDSWIDGSLKRHEVPTITPTELKRVAPIVWERKPDGSEYVTVHNAFHSYATSWYEFMRRYMPLGMDWLRSRDGRQWIEVRMAGTGTRQKFIMPRNRYLTKPNAAMRTYTTWVKDGRLSPKPSAERKLTFKRHERQGERWGRVVEWELIGEAYTTPTASRYIIDKDAKRELKPYITEFKEWARTIVPILQPRTWKDADAGRKLMCAHHADWPQANLHGGWWHQHHGNVLDVLRDPGSPGRIELAYEFIQYMQNCDYRTTYYRSDDNVTKDRFDERFNTFINIACGLRKPNTGEK